MTDILMPALSPTMEEGVLAKWHVKVGDMVKAGDVIAEIETDKATMEVEAVDEGEVTDILVAEGTEAVKVNTPIARLKDEAGAAVSSPPRAEHGEGDQPKAGGGAAPVRAAPTGIQVLPDDLEPPLHHAPHGPPPHCVERIE
jgi:pyruvate dehydrogenase E2 component (dihydrolipoamide acetyltransferase)